MSYVVYENPMLRINKDRSFTLMKTAHPIPSFDVDGWHRMPRPVIPVAQHKKRVDLTLWKEHNKHALSYIIEQILVFVSEMNTSPYTMSINVHTFIDLLTEKIYQSSENSLVDFMKS